MNVNLTKDAARKYFEWALKQSSSTEEARDATEYFLIETSLSSGFPAIRATIRDIVESLCQERISENG